MTKTFAEMGFHPAVTAASAAPATDGYFGTLVAKGWPFGIHPTETPDQYAALMVAIAANEVTVAPYVAPVAPPLTLPQQVCALLAGGLAVTSASVPALNATYSVGRGVQDHLQAEVTSILLNGTFADGAPTLTWPDATGVPHTFPSVALFKEFVTAEVAFVAAASKVANGTSTALPPAAATIA
jgi:hypothetical protein